MNDLIRPPLGHQVAKLTHGNRQLLITGLVLLAASVILFPLESWAESSSSGSPDFVKMGMRLAGGLAIFLFGMELMTDSLKAIAGEKLKLVLAKLTSNRIMGMVTGAAVTAVIQSSSVTTVLLVGFVSAGLMSLAQALGVIFGANIGTTITAQVIAFKVTKYAAIMIAGGFLMNMLGGQEKTRHYGKLILGLGLVFFGMSEMSGAMKPLRTFEPFMMMMQTVSSPLIGIMIAAAFTGLIQSSSATTGVVLALAMEGLVSLEGGIALILGANVGTCITAALAAIGKPREAVRVAVAHTTFNVIGALMVVGFIPAFSELVRSISPSHPELQGLERLAAEVPRQVANAHTIFNGFMAVVFLPFIGTIAAFCLKVIPEPEEGTGDAQAVAGQATNGVAEAVVDRPITLSKSLLATPPLAINMVRVKLIRRMGRPVKEMLSAALPAILDGNEEQLRRVEAMDRPVDQSYERLLNYLGQIAARSTESNQNREIANLIAVANDLEDLGDLIERGMIQLGRKRLDKELTLDDATRQLLERFHAEALAALEDGLRTIAREPGALEQMDERTHTIRRLSDEATSLESARLASNAPDKLAVHTVTMELYDKLRWVFFRSRRLAGLAHDPKATGQELAS